MRLAELAERVGAEWAGDGDCEIRAVNTLQDAHAGDIAFLANKRYRRYLNNTRASAVVLDAAQRADCPVSVVVSGNPYLTYAKISTLLNPEPEPVPGIHPSAVVEQSAQVDATAQIGPLVVVEANARIGPAVYLGPGCVIGSDCVIGEATRLRANVTLGAGTRIGRRCLIQPGAVIGGDGFGFANDNGRWVRVPQVGKVVLGDDVEVGANTAIDRGAIGDTLIGDGVKLDNLIQIAHNVQVGEHTAMAAFAGVSGSSVIGKHCTLAGMAGLVGHIELADGVHVGGMTKVTRSLSEPGVYTGNVNAMPHRDWARNMARFKQLDDMARRLKALEERLSDEAE